MQSEVVGLLKIGDSKCSRFVFVTFPTRDTAGSHFIFPSCFSFFFVSNKPKKWKTKILFPMQNTDGGAEVDSKKTLKAH